MVGTSILGSWNSHWNRDLPVTQLEPENPQSILQDLFLSWIETAFYRKQTTCDSLWQSNIANWKITMFNGKIHYFYVHFPTRTKCAMASSSQTVDITTCDSHHFPHSFPEMPPLRAIAAMPDVARLPASWLWSRCWSSLSWAWWHLSHQVSHLGTSPGKMVILPWFLHGTWDDEMGFFPVKKEDFPKKWRVFIGQDTTDHAQRGIEPAKNGWVNCEKWVNFPGKYGDCSCKKNRDSTSEAAIFGDFNCKNRGWTADTCGF